ncbi:MAG: 4-hydroxy-tetrahydrodipicolinate synthase [Ruminococcaceae bacterium]|nr:4-hydroxy-tetrahydrodipicolinate synthase [Oscillospiraceae bacterium]
MSKNKQSIFKGTATALVTPFADGKIDYIALERLIERQIDNGIDALVIAGTTGEASTLSDVEHRELLLATKHIVNGRVPLIAGTGSNDTAHAIETSRYAASIGYDALLVVTPYYNKATPQGLIKSFYAIADASSAPVIVYNVPTRTCCNVTLPVYRELAKHDNIVAVKEAGGNISAIAELLCECGDNLDVYSGNDDQTLPMLSLGGKGVISVVSNIIPKEMSALCRSWFEDDTKQSRHLHQSYLTLMKMMFCEVNPIPVKTALCLMGLCEGDLRLPMCEMEPENRERLKRALANYGLV